MVIADTSVWIPFFNRPDSSEKRALDLLIDADEVALIGVVLAELLQGCRSQGVTLPITDLLVVALAFEHSCAVYSLDEHFRKIPDLLRYSPTVR
ncbi:MAG: hypothetical protein HY581_06380 [Nitrospirae bacterium]|nr:hypothetical protein [Nitrospirota bacterium]